MPHLRGWAHEAGFVGENDKLGGVARVQFDHARLTWVLAVAELITMR